MSAGGNGDRVRETVKRYFDGANVLARINRKEFEDLIQQAIRGEGSNKDRLEKLFMGLKLASRQGVALLSTVVGAEIRREFGAVTKLRREDFNAAIERVVCLIEDRFGPARPPKARADGNNSESPSPAGSSKVIPAKVVAVANKATHSSPSNSSSPKKASVRKSGATSTRAPRKSAAKKASPSNVSKLSAKRPPSKDKD